MSVVLRPIQWGSLTHIDQVRPIDDLDSPVLEDIRAALEKHGCLDRFGIALLHRHFDVAPDEILLETTDESEREHWVRPVRQAALAASGVVPQTTILRFDEHGWSQSCGCDTDDNGHTRTHTNPVPD